MYTLKDVAKKANVSKSTVSRYFNNGYVSPINRELITKAIADLNYKPNAVARSIKTRKTNIVALVIPSISNPFFARLAEAFEGNNAIRGYKTILCNTRNDSSLELDYINMIMEQRLDGIVIASSFKYDYVVKNNIPIVYLDYMLGDENYISVTSKHYDGVQKACGHLINNGCKRLLYVYTSGSSGVLKLRKDAFIEFVTSYRLDYKIVTLEEAKGISLADYDGIVCWNDMVAVDILNICSKQKLQVPADIQVIGYDNIEISEKVTPQITTISQPIDLIGSTASEKIINLIEGKDTSGSILFDNELVVRDSTIKK